MNGGLQFDAVPPEKFCFGPFELEVRSAELRKGGIRVRLPEQPFQILLMLLDRPGEVVSREEIQSRLWPDSTVVEFDHSINAAVKRLRDSLRESADNPRYVETIPRRGYRFICQVEVKKRNAPSPSEIVVGDPEPLVLPPQSQRAGENAPAAKAVATQRFWRLHPRISLGLALAPLLIAFGVWAYLARYQPVRWATEVALPQATSLVEQGNYTAAFPLIYRALRILPDHPLLNMLQRRISLPIPIRTTPGGASIYVKPYADPDGPWLFVGTSPLTDFLLPIGYFRWRVTKPGFRTIESANGIRSSSIEFVLDREGTVPDDMAHVPAGSARAFGGDPEWLEDFWIDRHEVTNRQFKRFVDLGGYRKPEYWREEFVNDGRVLSWEEAMAAFRDATGRPGPLSWEAGDYPRGRDDFPVNGVSWYEAAAYARFVARQIPTVYHWYRAADQGIYSDILTFSNFSSGGPWRVGSRPGLGPYGTYDMAGNVKEWCWNSTGDRRYILGGGWNDGRSHYATPDALPGWDRSLTNGFRCIRTPSGAFPGSLGRVVGRPGRSTRVPVTEDAFRLLSRFYSYDKTPLRASTESVTDSSQAWRVERITLDAAYGSKRLVAWLYLPKNTKPPYQTVIYSPAGHARTVANIDEAEISRFDFLIKSGRAVLLPVYSGTYERRGITPPGPNGRRDQDIEACKDFKRSVDYLQSRADIQVGALGFFGISAGARLGLIMLAEEPRIHAATLAELGISAGSQSPETDETNFAPRVRMPVLMLNGRYDFVYPLESSQLPLFSLLGTRPTNKRHVLFETGHMGTPQQYIKETLSWFDQYLGPVRY